MYCERHLNEVVVNCSVILIILYMNPVCVISNITLHILLCNIGGFLLTPVHVMFALVMELT